MQKCQHWINIIFSQSSPWVDPNYEYKSEPRLTCQSHPQRLWAYSSLASCLDNRQLAGKSEPASAHSMAAVAAAWLHSFREKGEASELQVVPLQVGAKSIYRARKWQNHMPRHCSCLPPSQHAGTNIIGKQVGCLTPCCGEVPDDGGRAGISSVFLFL